MLAEMFRRVYNLFKVNETNEEEEIFEPILVPVFDTKYKTIIKCIYSAEYLTMLEWIDQHSIGLVDVKVPGDGWIYFAFEDPDDALVFKIMYST